MYKQIKNDVLGMTLTLGHVIFLPGDIYIQCL